MQAMPQHDKADGHSTCRHTGIDAGRALVAVINKKAPALTLGLLHTLGGRDFDYASLTWRIRSAYYLRREQQMRLE